MNLGYTIERDHGNIVPSNHLSSHMTMVMTMVITVQERTPSRNAREKESYDGHHLSRRDDPQSRRSGAWAQLGRQVPGRYRDVRLARPEGTPGSERPQTEGKP